MKHLSLAVLILPIAVGLFLPSTSLANDQMDGASEEVYQFDLPIGDLADTLIEFALQSEISITVVQENIKGYRSSPVVGPMGIQQALRQILANSPLGFYYDEHTRSASLFPSKVASADTDQKTHSEVEVLQEEGVIVTASGFRTALYKAPAIAAVVTADDIRKYGARTLDSALNMVPGLHVAVSDFSRLDSVFSIRGIHTGFNPHVLFMVNGTPVTFSIQGSRPIAFRLPSTSIDQIEIVRGPGSAIYGADAYSGVVNVITKGNSDEEHQNNTGYRYGSFNQKEFWNYSSGELMGWNSSFSFTYQKGDGDDNRIVNSDQQAQFDAIFGTNASLTPGPLSSRYELYDTHLMFSKDGWDIKLWSWISNDTGLGAGLGQSLDLKGGDDNELYMADLRYEFGDGSDNWSSSIKAVYFHCYSKVRANLFPAGAVLPIGSDGNINFSESSNLVSFPDGFIGHPGGTSRDYSFDWVSKYSGFDNHRWRIATGYKKQAADPAESKNFGPGIIDGSQPVVDGTLTNVSNSPFIYLKKTSRENVYVSLQDEWRIGSGLELTAGVRYDKYSDFGSTTNPRVALVWEVNDYFSTKLLSGKAYRAPSFSEQFYTNNPILLGNPDLDPEEIVTHELSFTMGTHGKLVSTLSLFTYQAEGMIEFVDDGEQWGRQVAQNSRDQDGTGIEWELSWSPLGNVDIDVSYAFQDSRDSKTNDKIPDAPRQKASLNVYWELTNSLQLGVHVNHIGNRPRRVTDEREQAKDYTLTDLNLVYSEVFKGIDLSLTVRNAEDIDAREPSSGPIADDFPLESRSFALGASLRY